MSPYIVCSAPCVLWIIVNVNCVHVCMLVGCPSPCSCISSVRHLLNTLFCYILVSSFLDPRVYRDRIIHHTRWSSPASAAHRARRLREVCRCPRLARARHRSRQTEARWCLCWLRPAHLLRRWSCPARLRLHWFRPVPRYPSAPRYPWVC